MKKYFPIQYPLEQWLSAFCGLQALLQLFFAMCCLRMQWLFCQQDALLVPYV
jgi:hypothetical protein